MSRRPGADSVGAAVRLDDIADLLGEWRENKARQRVLREEMARVCVEDLKLSQEWVGKNMPDIPALLDGYLIGQGKRQKWRDAA